MNEVFKYTEGKIKWNFSKIPGFLLKAVEQMLIYVRLFADTEAMVQIIYDRKYKGYYVYIPEQQAAKTSVSVKKDSQVPSGSYHVMDIYLRSKENYFANESFGMEERGCNGIVGVFCIEESLETTGRQFIFASDENNTVITESDFLEEDEFSYCDVDEIALDMYEKWSEVVVFK